MGLFGSLCGLLGGDNFDGGKHYIGRPYYDSLPSGGRELEEFMAAGGTFIMPATNTTHLYYEAKKVYDKLPEDVLRYLVLQINSGSAREEMPLTYLRDFVKTNLSLGWKEFCLLYTWTWADLVSHTPKCSVPLSLVREADEKTRIAIERAKTNIECGMHRYEEFLRGIPQYRIMQVLMEFQTGEGL